MALRSVLGIVSCLALSWLIALGGESSTARAEGLVTPAPSTCVDELHARGVDFRRTRRAGIAIPVEIRGPLGGVTYVYRGGALVIDCSLAVSLAEVGRYWRALGIDRIDVASAWSQRFVRGTSRLSKHAYGLAIDVPRVAGPSGSFRVDLHYEWGLGGGVDCLGAPQTEGGRLLKIAQCQLVRSGLFHLVLSPDYDEDHRDHFHLEARPWSQRATLRAEPAIH